LADNGGPVQTMALGGGSPCIDAGDFLGGNAPTTDARGTARPSGIGYDMGAYEYGAGFLDLRINGELFEPYDANATIGGIAYGAITYGATPVVLTGTLMVGGQAPSGAVLISISRASIKGEVLPVTITQQRVLVNSLTGAFSAKFDSRTYPASEGTDSQGVGKTWYYLITYRFGDLSATRELLVQKADPLFSRLSPPDGTSGLLGGARRATGTIKHPNGRLVPTGKVTVTMSGTGREASLSGSIMAGLGTFSVSFTAAMLPKDTTYTITYYYPGDANYNPLQAAPGPR
jgi:hypothetical protein